MNKAGPDPADIMTAKYAGDDPYVYKQLDGMSDAELRTFQVHAHELAAIATRLLAHRGPAQYTFSRDNGGPEVSPPQGK